MSAEGFVVVPFHFINLIVSFHKEFNFITLDNFSVSYRNILPKYGFLIGFLNWVYNGSSSLFSASTNLKNACHFTWSTKLKAGKRNYLGTGYSFWDRLRNFFTQICQFISWTNWVNSGKFMDNCWILCQVMADMKKVYDDLIIINL